MPAPLPIAEIGEQTFARAAAGPRRGSGVRTVGIPILARSTCTVLVLQCYEQYTVL